MASTSSVSQANAELACSPRRSGENLPTPELCQPQLAGSDPPTAGGQPLVAGVRARDPAGTKMDMGPVLEIPSRVTDSPERSGWDGGKCRAGQVCDPVGREGVQEEGALELRLEGVRS